MGRRSGRPLRSYVRETDRINREKEFHNAAFAQNIRDSITKYYAIAGKAFDHYSETIYRIASGDRVLEYGCGAGSYAFHLARKGAKVTGIDISEEAIAKANALKAASGLPVEFQVMDAETLDFPDGSFDLICGSGILHHLDLEKAFAEIARVLSPNGKAVFLEPLGHNPLVKAYRSRTRELRTEDEHPLKMRDITTARKYFPSISYRTFCFTSLLAIPFIGKPRFRPWLDTLTKIDEFLEKRCPVLRRYYWIAVVEMSGPR